MSEPYVLLLNDAQELRVVKSSTSGNVGSVDAGRPAQRAGARTGHASGALVHRDYDVSCGRTMRVKDRIARIVDEATGKMRRIRDTVTLEHAFCTRHHRCAQGMPALWGEAWLRRVEGPNA